MQQIYWALAAVGTGALLFGLASKPIKNSWVSFPILAVTLGIAVGPAGAGLVRPDAWAPHHTLLREVAQLTLAVGIMGITLRVPPVFWRRHWLTVAAAVGPLMLAMWALSSGFALVLGLPLLMALLLGASLTPTDPIVASAIVTGGPAEKILPGHLRHTLSAESGANDGLAYPFMMLPLLLLQHSGDAALKDWLLKVILGEVVGALVLGALIGAFAGYLLRLSERHDLVDEQSFLAFSLSLTLAALGLVELTGANGLLGVLAAGVAVSQVVNAADRHQDEKVQEMVNQLLVLPIFILFGALLPWAAWGEFGWREALFVLLLLTLRRLPAVLLLRRWMPALKRRDDAIFAGWFGPIGVAAIYYGVEIASKSGNERLWEVGSLAILASIVVFGATAAVGTRAYGGRAAGQ